MRNRTKAEPNDGHGWYIISVEDGVKSLRSETRYNLKEAAVSSAAFFYRNETCIVLWWDGEWHEERPNVS
jgi:hypothetical protein